MYSIDESEGNVITLLDRIENGLLGGELKPVILTCGPLPMMKPWPHGLRSVTWHVS